MSRARIPDPPSAALTSLEVRPFSHREVHDAAGVPMALAWPEGVIAGEVVTSYPAASGLEGAPPGFAKLADRSFLYDDALLSLDRIRRGDHKGAARVLASIAALQLPDGAWGFSVGAEDAFYDAGFVRSGTVSFLVYAFARYAERFQGEPWVSEAALRGGAWLLGMRDPATGLVRAGRGFWSHDGSRLEAGVPADFAATEHQLDAFFALAALGRIDPEGPWTRSAAELGETILDVLWLDDDGRFAQGWGDAGIDRRSALDASGSWGALFLLACGERKKAERALSWVDEVHVGPSGFRPYASGPDTWFVEGSVAVALAWHRLQPGSDRASRELSRLTALAETHGWPLVYSTVWEPDFPHAPAAGPTLWYLLAEAEVRGEAPFLWNECPVAR